MEVLFLCLTPYASFIKGKRCSCHPCKARIAWVVLFAVCVISTLGEILSVFHLPQQDVSHSFDMTKKKFLEFTLNMAFPCHPWTKQCATVGSHTPENESA